MTRERWSAVSLDEITAIRWTCPSCHVALSLPLAQPVRLPRVCPGCNQDAIDADVRLEDRAAQQFVQVLKQLLRDANHRALQLEFLERDDD